MISVVLHLDPGLGLAISEYEWTA